MGRQRIDWDEVELTPAQQEAALSVLPLAMQLVHRALRRGGVARPENDDVESLAHEACCKAAATHDPAKAKLTTWVGWWVRAAALEFFRDAGLCPKAVAADEAISFEADRRAVDPIVAALQADELRGVRDGLTPNEWLSLKLTLGDGLSLREAGPVMGLSRGRVQQLREEGRERLRRAGLFGGVA